MTTSTSKESTKSKATTSSGQGSEGKLSGLIFITAPRILAENIGSAEANKALGMVTDWGGTLCEIKPGLTARAVLENVRPLLQTDKIHGVVVLGGLDVVPSERVNVLDDSLRDKVERMQGNDSDDFIVWSDDLFGDRDGDGFAELPVSRIPDGRKASVVLTALASKPGKNLLRFGVRNIDRPFADAVFQSLPGTQTMRVSEPTVPESLEGLKLSGKVYFMLHGMDSDGTRYWGEDGHNNTIEAIELSNLPTDADGTIVFLGCCWGGLTALPTAKRASGNFRIRPRTPEQSIAITYLAAGASAVVGCTGTHYSPNNGNFDYYGQPMHVQFWKRLAAVSSPAKALFEAKIEYAKQIPHAYQDPISQAIELKIWRQYSCLGLGW